MCCLELIEALKRRIRLQSEKPDNIKLDVTSDKLLLEYASLWNLARLKVSFINRVFALICLARLSITLCTFVII